MQSKQQTYIYNEGKPDRYTEDQWQAIINSDDPQFVVDRINRIEARLKEIRKLFKDPERVTLDNWDILDNALFKEDER